MCVSIRPYTNSPHRRYLSIYWNVKKSNCPTGVVQRISFRKKMNEKNIIWLTISSFFFAQTRDFKIDKWKTVPFWPGFGRLVKRRMWVKSPPRQLAGGWGSWQVPAYSNFFVKVGFWSLLTPLKVNPCSK